jgi:RNA polymerase sigma-70 factor (ECF subfamily)
VAGFLCRLGVARAELDDAVQEVFLIAHTRGGFTPGEAQPTTWLAEIALRVASGQKRTSRRRTKREQDAAVEDIVTETPFETVAGAETRNRITRALDTLTLEHRAVFILYEIEEQSCESIAAGLGVPIGTVYSRLHKARDRFRNAYCTIVNEPRLAAENSQPGAP